MVPLLDALCSLLYWIFILDHWSIWDHPHPGENKSYLVLILPFSLSEKVLIGFHMEYLWSVPCTWSEISIINMALEAKHVYAGFGETNALGGIFAQFCPVSLFHTGWQTPVWSALCFPLGGVRVVWGQLVLILSLKLMRYLGHPSWCLIHIAEKDSMLVNEHGRTVPCVMNSLA